MQYPNRLIKIGERDQNIVKAIQSRLNEVGVSNCDIFATQKKRCINLIVGGILINDKN
jgi:hypothetical protein